MLHFKTWYPYSRKPLDYFYMSCWVGSDSWWISGWVISIMFCSQQPCSASANSCIWLSLWSHSISYSAFLFFSCLLLLSVHPPFFFSKNSYFSWCAQRKTMLILSFLASRCFKLNFLYNISCSSAVCRALLHHYSSNEWILFLSAFFTVQL